HSGADRETPWHSAPAAGPTARVDTTRFTRLLRLLVLTLEFGRSKIPSDIGAHALLLRVITSCFRWFSCTRLVQGKRERVREFLIRRQPRPILASGTVIGLLWLAHP